MAKKLIKFVKKCFENENLTIDTEQLKKYMGLQKYFDFELFEWGTICIHTALLRVP